MRIVSNQRSMFYRKSTDSNYASKGLLMAIHAVVIAEIYFKNQCSSISLEIFKNSASNDCNSKY